LAFDKALLAELNMTPVSDRAAQRELHLQGFFFGADAVLNVFAPSTC
jgi:hypothetical protein